MSSYTRQSPEGTDFVGLTLQCSWNKRRDSSWVIVIIDLPTFKAKKRSKHQISSHEAGNIGAENIYTEGMETLSSTGKSGTWRVVPTHQNRPRNSLSYRSTQNPRKFRRQLQLFTHLTARQTNQVLPPYRLLLKRPLATFFWVEISALPWWRRKTWSLVQFWQREIIRSKTALLRYSFKVLFISQLLLVAVTISAN